MQDCSCACGHLRSNHTQGSSEAGAMLEDGPCLFTDPVTGRGCGCLIFYRAPDQKHRLTITRTEVIDRHTEALEKLADATTRIADVLERLEGDGVAVRR